MPPAPEVIKKRSLLKEEGPTRMNTVGVNNVPFVPRYESKKGVDCTIEYGQYVPVMSWVKERSRNDRYGNTKIWNA